MMMIAKYTLSIRGDSLLNGVALESQLPQAPRGGPSPTRVHSVFTYGVNNSSGACALWQSPLKDISESLDKFEVNYGINYTV